MAEVKWTLQATDDLETIASFIAESSPHYAGLFAIDILAAAERLATFPKSGRIVPEKKDPAIREIIFGSYRLVYRIKGPLVQILTVWHGARLLDPSRLA